MAGPRYPSLFQVNTRVRLSELSAALGRPATLDDERLLVDAAKVSDATAPSLAFEIARAIEERLDYPGEVRVTVVRETRAVDVAH